MFIIGISYSTTAISQLNDIQIGSYKNHFSKKVLTFSKKNRLQITNINRDKYMNCYIWIRFNVVIASNGSIKSLILTNPSPVEVVNNYYSYLISEAAPFDPLEMYFGKELEEFTITEEYKLDIKQQHDAVITKPCN